MRLDLYWIALLVLTPLVVLAVGHGVLMRPFKQLLRAEPEPTPLDKEAREFRKVFLRVFLTAMASEWFQGSYTYALFRHEKDLSEWTVAMLFVTFYASAATSAFFTGYLADRFGRRAACLAFCGIHCLASISVVFNSLEILIVGRVLGGIALTLLWTTFESWMVTEYNARGLSQSSLKLTAMFGIMTTANCITAILAGILGHCLVLVFGSNTDPFVIGVALDLCAALLLLYTWNENWGATNNRRPDQEMASGDAKLQMNSENDPKEHRGVVTESLHSLKNIKIWILSFVSCCFEGTLFLLVFFWPGALQDAHDLEFPDEAKSSIPLGVVFAAFMAIMVLGALFFNAVTGYTGGTGRSVIVRALGPVAKYLGPTPLLGGALLIGSVSYLIAALAQTQAQFFCAFLLVELCNGIYVPSMAFHRSTIVSDKGRTSIYGIMNIPLFVFVVGALCTTGSDKTDHRQYVFFLCAGLLLLASLATFIGLREFLGSCGFSEVSVVDPEEAIDEVEELKRKAFDEVVPAMLSQPVTATLR